MASFEQIYYCKNCKKNVAVRNGKCKTCGSTQLNKTWSTRFRYIEDDGVEKQKRLSGFSTKKEAQDAVIKFQINHKMNNKKIKNLSFRQLYDEYETFLRTRTKASTHYDFVSKCKKLLPFFEKYDVKKITPKIILDWQNTLEKFSYNYKCHIRTCLSGLLRYAEKYYDIPNQLVKVDNFRRVEPKKEIEIWTPEQFNKVMANVKKFEYKVFYTALFYTGARKGELLATFWDDWDLINKTLNIDKSISHKVTGGSWMITSPKNSSSVRKIKITDSLAELISQLKIIKQNNKTIGRFTFGDDKPLPETCICRYLTNAAKEADVPIIKIHNLRHSHASLLINQGVSIVAVAKRLGHSSIEQTLNTYAHMMPNEEDDLIKKLQNVI